MLVKRIFRASSKLNRYAVRGIHLPPDYRSEVISSIYNNDNVSFHSNISREEWTKDDIEEFDELAKKTNTPPKGYVKNKMQFFIAGNFFTYGLISSYSFVMYKTDIISFLPIPIGFTAAYYFFNHATISDEEYRRRHREIKKELEELRNRVSNEDQRQ